MAASPPSQPIDQITVDAFSKRLHDAESPLQLIDVREPEELAIAQLPGFINLPLSQFAEWSGQIGAYLDPHVETIVMCHHGVRSAQMCHWLTHQGFTQVKNLAGGIDAYTVVVDDTIPRY